MAITTSFRVFLQEMAPTPAVVRLTPAVLANLLSKLTTTSAWDIHLWNGGGNRLVLTMKSDYLQHERVLLGTLGATLGQEAREPARALASALAARGYAGLTVAPAGEVRVTQRGLIEADPAVLLEVDLMGPKAVVQQLVSDAKLSPSPTR